METNYSIETCEKLQEKFVRLGLDRPQRIRRYDPGTELTYQVSDILSSRSGPVRMRVERFAGGGFAGQVYQVKILQVDPGLNIGIKNGQLYAVKILIPPSVLSRFFRNLLYRIGFCGPFQLQVNPSAARSGALWQKFIRRAAKIRFGTDEVVNDVLAIFVDERLGSCGEISNWVEGRTWKLEVDEHIDLLRKHLRGRSVNPELLGSPEYRAKRVFMRDFVNLLQEMGAHEFARQYEWSTAKSQPNCLKLCKYDHDPGKGLVAVDFRAGLTLFPFLPMSPGDVKLILKGLFRGSLIQFDRGNLKKLRKFMDRHPKDFTDLEKNYRDLIKCEKIYRNSIPDLTHNLFKLFYSRRFWSTFYHSTITGWKVGNTSSPGTCEALNRSILKFTGFYLLGAIPFLGGFIRKLWARPDWRGHYKKILRLGGYLKRSIRGRCAEKALAWHRAGRVNEKKALQIAESFCTCLRHLPLAILPAGLHKFLTNRAFFTEKLHYIFIRPVKLYFNAQLRKEWLYEMIQEGEKKRILDQEDARVIKSQVDEPFIQKYLKSLAVHICTLPVTQVVSLAVAGIYILMHPELTWAEASAIGLGIIALFQVIPVSPGSLVRGLYVVYLVLRERNFQDYKIAVYLSFFKYIGYLAFPIQMAYRYPELARFMAGHWATEAVHIVPVFGERGALLEHWVFGLFYNWPLTIRRRLDAVAERRRSQKSRYWHLPIFILFASGGLLLFEYIFLTQAFDLPGLGQTWWVGGVLGFALGSAVAHGCGGATLGSRILSAVLSGIITGILFGSLSLSLFSPVPVTIGVVLAKCAWFVFIITFFSVMGGLITELKTTW